MNCSQQPNKLLPIMPYGSILDKMISILQENPLQHEIMNHQYNTKIKYFILTFDHFLALLHFLHN